MMILKKLLDEFCEFVAMTYGVRVERPDSKEGNEHARWMLGNRVFAILDYDGDSEDGMVLEVISGDKPALQRLEQIWNAQLGAIVGTLEDEDENE